MPTVSIRALIPLAILVASCTEAKTPPAGESGTALVKTGVDSCMALPSTRTQYANPAEARIVPPPGPGRWDSVRTESTAEFSIDVPAVATPGVSHWGRNEFALTNFPQCSECDLAVRTFADSTERGLDGLIATILQSVAVTNSINKDPRSKTGELNAYSGPHHDLQTAAGRAVWIEGSGDGISGSLFLSRGKRFAEVWYSVSDEVDGPRKACLLTKVATTFRWTPR